ncbi:beta-ketoacyl synthase N-terminal-like domain-containing protein [Streptomyces sp. NRRL S-87]|uniref:beta-ketoacyl synthase N-terminal-like domain-containing protein n=1 Tax=Streptomyces sp. NRRL S-87 TaxID=1463920 RepID=UPI00069194C4|nr:beta-ketoacyl synthase N-terminal-like domain-containing protein [Streptomyces sp. NRRL S-87]
MAAATVAESLVHGAGLVLPPAGHTPGAPWFDHRARLGRGHRFLPAAGQYLVAAGRDALAAVDGWTERQPAERRGAVVGTNSAVAAVHADIDATVRRDGAGALSPMGVPFFSVNLVAVRLSTEHRLKGFNLTVTSPRVAGVEALHLAARELAAGRADTVLSGAAEAPDPWAGDAAPEDGAALLLLHPAPGVAPRGAAAREVRPAAPDDPAVLRTTLRFVPPPALTTPEGRARAAAAVHDALESLHPTGGAPPEIRLLADPSPVGGAVERAVRAWSAGRASVSTARSGPRAGSLAPVTELADGVLTGSPRPLLVVAAAAQGNVAFAALSSPNRPEPTKRCDTC